MVIVAMDKAPERNFMKLIGLGKGKGLADKAHPEGTQTLAQDVVPAFNMGGLPRFFADRVMVSAQMTKNLVIGLPKITKGSAMTISPW